MTGSTNTGRRFHTATLLADGTVLIASRVYSDVSAEIYDPSTETFRPTGHMTKPHTGQATLLADGRVLIVGELGDRGAEIYDPSTGAFRATGEMIELRWYVHTACLLPNGKVLIQGSPTPELYDPATGTFTPTGEMTWPFHYTATLLMNGKVLFTGGDDDPGETAIAEVYSPSTGMFTAAIMTIARSDHTATLLPDGTVLIAGSQGNGGRTLAGAEIYDPASSTFTIAAAMVTDRGAHTATLLNDGRVLVAGGVHQLVEGTWSHLSSAELYTPTQLVRAPLLFSLSGNGQGQGAILHTGTTRLVSSGDPAIAGEALEIYLTGLGDGSGVIPPQVAIGGRMAEILYFGGAPGYPGVNQVNVRVPSGIAPGPAVPVRVTYLGRPSNEVTMGMR